jgi:Acetylornithine deacetylase/Succinyl-diaminopimelate desuccinylase and related deacylases
MTDIKTYIEENKQRILDELFGLIRIPSISSQSDHKGDMIKAAEYIKDALLKAGADRAEVMPSAGNPVVFGEKIVDTNAPTVLIYAHYDVMPVDPLELWTTNPFEPTIKDGKIFARGANDDKGQMFVQLKAFEYLVKTGQLKTNVKFMIEGEEEIGSPSLEEWAKKNKDLVAADVILVSDTGMIAENVPTITQGLRGLAYMEVEVTGASRDLHSGLFGGAVANPINVLAKMIASSIDDNGHITIPGFYDDVKEVSAEDRAMLAKAPFNLETYKKSLDIDEVEGEVGYSTNERTGIRPSLDVNGIWGGYTGEGSKTVTPSKAFAKISMRLVPDQDYHKISDLFKAYFEKIAPKSVKIKVTAHHGGYPYVAPSDHPGYVAASLAYVDVYGEKPIPVRSGGSIPIITTFERVLGLKTILMGFGLEEDAIHSPNESFSLNRLFMGIETVSHFYAHFNEEMKK